MGLIFLMESEHFTYKNYYDLYVDRLSKHFQYEIWDCLLLNQSRLEKFDDIEVPNRIDEAVIISDIADLEKRIVEMETNPIIVTQYFTNKKIYETVKKHGGYVIEINKVSFHMDLRRRALKKFNTRTIARKLINSLKNLKNLKKSSNPYSILVDYSLNPLKMAEVNVGEFILMHHIKYDEFLQAKGEQPILEKRYMVFIDIYLPYLSDVLHKGKSINPDKYYESLNSLFERIENKYGLEVVIAPHPKAIYDETTFDGRKIIFGKTANLICNSVGIITHDSTSNITAVLARKPIIFVYSEEMLTTAASRFYYTTKEFSKMLNGPFVNLDKPTSVALDLDVNEKAYKSFEKKYVVNEEKEDKTNEQIITDFLRKLDAS